MKNMSFGTLQNLSLVLIFLSLVGCASIITGRDFDAALVQNIKKNSTTKAEIIQMFGDAPHTKTVTDDREIWSYMYHATKASVGLITPKVEQTSMKILSITFKDNIVIDFSYSETAPSVYK